MSILWVSRLIPVTNIAPVSVKAALRRGDRWVLLRNDREEWELPGGQIDPGDLTLKDTLRRECAEELGVEVQVDDLVDSWLFEVVPGKRVTIICFAAHVDATSYLVTSHEHDAVGLFSTDELDELPLPTGYRNAILLAAELAAADAGS